MTAVEWYIKKIKEARQMCDDTSMEMDIWHTLDVLIEKGEQAKEMEKQQQYEFAVVFAEWLLIIYNEDIIYDAYSKEELLEIYKKENGL